MINLAGIDDADKYIREELYLAGIPMKEIPKGNTEVPYSVIGELGNWTFKRAWYYWMASVEEIGEGLPLDLALKLYSTKHPTDFVNLGNVIRAGGCAASTSPNSYISQPIYNRELETKLEALGYKKQYSDFLERKYLSISNGEIAELCNQGKLIIQRYVSSYHIDEQIGLKEFADFIKKYMTPKN